MEGFYSVTYGGAFGLGMAVLVFQGGRVTGADGAGGTYDGTFAPVAAGIALDVSVTIPPGFPLVTGAPAQTVPYTFPIRSTLPAGLGGGQPVQVPTPTGTVAATFKKLRNI